MFPGKAAALVSTAPRQSPPQPLFTHLLGGGCVPAVISSTEQKPEILSQLSPAWSSCHSKYQQSTRLSCQEPPWDVSTPGAGIWKYLKPQNTRGTRGDAAPRICPAVSHKSPGPGLRCEQTWSCSGKPAGWGGPHLLPPVPRLPQNSPAGGQSWVFLSPREAEAAPCRLCSTQGSLFYLLNRSRLLQAALIHDSVSIDTLLLSQHNSEAAAGLGGAGSDTKSRAQGLLPDSFSL